MHGVTTHVVKGKRGLNCKSSIEHYLLAHLTTFSQHGGHVQSSNRTYTWIQEETLTHSRGEYGVKKPSQMMSQMGTNDTLDSSHVGTKRGQHE
jgi:hypothetical protein